MMLSPCLENFVIVHISMFLTFAVVFSLADLLAHLCVASAVSACTAYLLLGDFVVTLLNKVFYVMDKVSKPWASHLK